MQIINAILKQSCSVLVKSSVMSLSKYAGVLDARFWWIGAFASYSLFTPWYAKHIIHVFVNSRTRWASRLIMLESTSTLPIRYALYFRLIFCHDLMSSIPSKPVSLTSWCYLLVFFETAHLAPECCCDLRCTVLIC